MYLGAHVARFADLIDKLTLNPDERRRVVRLLGQLEANAQKTLDGEPRGLGQVTIDGGGGREGLTTEEREELRRWD